MALGKREGLKDARNAAICVGLLTLGSFLAPSESLQYLAIYPLFPGAMAAYLVQDNPHGGTVGQLILGAILFFLVNTGLYALVFAGMRRVWNNSRQRDTADRVDR